VCMFLHSLSNTVGLCGMSIIWNMECWNQLDFVGIILEFNLYFRNSFSCWESFQGVNLVATAWFQCNEDFTDCKRNFVVLDCKNSGLVCCQLDLSSLCPFTLSRDIVLFSSNGVEERSRGPLAVTWEEYNPTPTP